MHVISGLVRLKANAASLRNVLQVVLEPAVFRRRVGSSDRRAADDVVSELLSLTWVVAAWAGEVVDCLMGLVEPDAQAAGSQGRGPLVDRVADVGVPAAGVRAGSIGHVGPVAVWEGWVGEHLVPHLRL